MGLADTEGALDKDGAKLGAELTEGAIVGLLLSVGALVEGAELVLGFADVVGWSEMEGAADGDNEIDGAKDKVGVEDGSQEHRVGSQAPGPLLLVLAFDDQTVEDDLEAVLGHVLAQGLLDRGCQLLLFDVHVFFAVFVAVSGGQQGQVLRVEVFCVSPCKVNSMKMC